MNEVSGFQITMITPSKSDCEFSKAMVHAREHQLKMARYLYFITGRMLGRW